MTEAPALRITPPPFLRSNALAKLFRLLPDARIVGGAVRDAVARHRITDIDLATATLPAEVTKRLRKARIQVIPTGLAHGTVTALLYGRAFEITTLRRDVSTDGRRATVAFTDDWRQDAERRDFTINALSMTLDGQVFDYFGGLADLRAGIVRFVGEPVHRIAEDYLRILRYFRFFARYAAAPPDAATRAALHDGIPGLAQLSVERIWSELRRILAAPDPIAALTLMAELDILPAVIPEGADLAALARLVAVRAPVDPLLRLAALLTGEIDPFADRLRLSGADRKRLLTLRATGLAQPDDDDNALRRLLADHDRTALLDRTWLNGAATRKGTALRTRLTALPQPVFPLEGNDLLALGVAPGKQVGALLREMRAWWLEGGCIASKADCHAELMRRLHESAAIAFVDSENTHRIE